MLIATSDIVFAMSSTFAFWESYYIVSCLFALSIMDRSISQIALLWVASTFEQALKVMNTISWTPLQSPLYASSSSIRESEFGS